MAVSALADNDEALLCGQNARKRRRLQQPLRCLPRIPQQGEQFEKSIRRLLGVESNLAPFFEPMRSGVAVSQPAVNILERDAQKRRPSRWISPFEFVRNKWVRRGHARDTLTRIPSTDQPPCIMGAVFGFLRVQG